MVYGLEIPSAAGGGFSEGAWLGNLRNTKPVVPLYGHTEMHAHRVTEEPLIADSFFSRFFTFV